MRVFLNVLREVNWLKTIYFNFHYFSVSKAIHLPVFIFRSTQLVEVKGKVLLNCPIRTGIVRIGIHDVGTVDIKYNRTIWQCSGTVIFDGSTSIGSGTKLSINRQGTINFGDKFCVTGNSSIICSKKITFGKECLLSWDILIMDTDFHNIYNEQKVLVNTSKSIHIGNHVWIGCRNIILKGVNIADNVVIAAGSKITKNVNQSDCIVGGQDMQTVIKDKIYWEK